MGSVLPSPHYKVWLQTTNKVFWCLQTTNRLLLGASELLVIFAGCILSLKDVQRSIVVYKFGELVPVSQRGGGKQPPNNLTDACLGANRFVTFVATGKDSELTVDMPVVKAHAIHIMEPEVVQVIGDVGN